MQRLDTPAVYDLSSAELREAEALLGDHGHRAPSDDPGGEEYYEQIRELTHRLPAGLRRFLRVLRTTEHSAAAIVRGLPVDDAALGPTPGHWRNHAASRVARREERWLALLGLAMGEPFSWSTLEQGRMIQNVLPIAGEEERQSRHGQVRLAWHTEDAFHPYRCDHLLVMGLRNHDAVATTLASVRDVRIGAGHRGVLRERRFHILPDDEHLRATSGTGLVRMRAMQANPEPVAVLFGAEDHPYLRIDPSFMRCLPGDAEAAPALKHLETGLEDARQQVVLRPGEVLVIDNYRAVHGRQGYPARFDGTDRWLKKMTVTGDLRRSRDQRAHPGSRVIR